MNLVDEFSSHRSVATYVSIAIMTFVIVAGYLDPPLFRWLFQIAIVLVLAVSLFLQLTIFRRLLALSLSPDYVGKFRIQSVSCRLIMYSHFPCLRTASRVSHNMVSPPGPSAHLPRFFSGSQTPVGNTFHEAPHRVLMSISGVS